MNRVGPMNIVKILALKGQNVQPIAVMNVKCFISFARVV